MKWPIQRRFLIVRPPLPLANTYGADGRGAATPRPSLDYLAYRELRPKNFVRVFNENHGILHRLWRFVVGLEKIGSYLSAAGASEPTDHPESTPRLSCSALADDPVAHFVPTSFSSSTSNGEASCCIWRNASPSFFFLRALSTFAVYWKVIHSGVLFHTGDKSPLSVTLHSPVELHLLHPAITSPPCVELLIPSFRSMALGTSVQVCKTWISPFDAMLAFTRHSSPSIALTNRFQHFQQ